MITFEQFEKVAFPLYDYTASAANSFIPSSPKMPKIVEEEEKGKKVNIPAEVKTDIPKPGKNTPSNTDTTTFPYYHSFQPTISGTGGGPQLWTLPKDPYAN